MYYHRYLIYFKYSKLPDFGLCLLVAISGNCTRMGFVGGMSKTTFNTEATSPSIVYKGDSHSLKKNDLTKVLRFMTYHQVCKKSWKIIRIVATRVTRRVPLMEQELFSSQDFNPRLCGVRIARSVVLCVVYCRSVCVLFHRPLCCLSFDLRILIANLVSSHSS